MRSHSSAKNQNQGFIKRPVSLGVLVVSTAILILALARTSDAGPISFLRDALGNERASAQTTRSFPNAVNSQRYPLPSYAANTNVMAYADLSASVPPVAEGKVLSADIAAANSLAATEPPNTQISVYVVRDGDTISGVAKLFNVSVNTVLWANDLTGRSVLQPGQTLVILPVTGINYTVRSGDTIQGIAKKYGADVGDILNYNDLTLASNLKIGDEILIPNAELSAPVAGSGGSGSGGSSTVSSSLSCPLPGGRVTQKIHGHNGVDLGAPVGTPIRAASSGTVIINRANGAWNGGYGNFIVILHAGGIQTLYSHMSRSTVVTGEQVTRGETVGYVGMTGLTTGPHLHFEVRGATNPFTDQSRCR